MKKHWDSRTITTKDRFHVNMSRVDRLRVWLIRKLVGNGVVIMNAEISIDWNIADKYVRIEDVPFGVIDHNNWFYGLVITQRKK